MSLDREKMCGYCGENTVLKRDILSILRKHPEGLKEAQAQRHAVVAWFKDRGMGDQSEWWAEEMLSDIEGAFQRVQKLLDCVHEPAFQSTQKLLDSPDWPKFSDHCVHCGAEIQMWAGRWRIPPRVWDRIT